MSEAQPDDFDTNLIAAFAAASKKARELGFNLASMKSSIQVAGNNFLVHFEQIPEPGFAILGGDLEIYVDLISHQIVKARRGQ